MKARLLPALAVLLALAGCGSRSEAPWWVHIVVKDPLGRRGPPPLLVYDEPAYRVGTPIERRSAGGLLTFRITALDDGEHLLALTFKPTSAGPGGIVQREARLKPGYGLRADTGFMRVDIQPQRAAP